MEIHDFIRFPSLDVGDPTITGWITAVSYFVAGAAALNAARFTRTMPVVIFWLSVGILLIVLGANKQLDLQTFLIDLGRQASRDQGWFEERRRVQLFLTIAMTGTVALASAAGLWLARRSDASIKYALLGLSAIGVYIGSRTAEMDHQVTSTRLLSYLWIFELMGILIVAAAAMGHTWRSDLSSRSKRVGRS